MCKLMIGPVGRFQRALHALLSSKLIINVRKATATTWTSPSALADPLDDRNLRATRGGDLPIDFAHSVEMQSRYTSCKCLVKPANECAVIDKILLAFAYGVSKDAKDEQTTYSHDQF